MADYKGIQGKSVQKLSNFFTILLQEHLNSRLKTLLVQAHGHQPLISIRQDIIFMEEGLQRQV